VGECSGMFLEVAAAGSSPIHNSRSGAQECSFCPKGAVRAAPTFSASNIHVSARASTAVSVVLRAEVG
jgi:hypothetical protein